MDPDERAEPYARVAAEYAQRVRDDAPPAFHRWLILAVEDIAGAEGRVVDVNDWVSVCTALAAAVPVDDESWKALTGWTWAHQFRGLGDGRPDTPEKVEQRRRDLLEALDPDWHDVGVRGAANRKARAA